jgi:hypothetical protein
MRARSSRPRARRPSPRLLDASPYGHRVLRLVRPEPRSLAVAAPSSPTASARPLCAFACRRALARRPPRSVARVLVLILRCRAMLTRSRAGADSPLLCALALVCCLSGALVGTNEQRQNEAENERKDK